MGVVAGGNGRPRRVRAVLGEAVGVALSGVDRDRHRLGEAAPARDPAAGVRGAGSLLRLPEDRLPPLHLREDELRARKPGTVEDKIDRRPAPAAGEDRRLLDDVCVLGPWLLEAVAVDARCRRPGRAGFEDQPALERQPQQVGQPAVFLRVARDEEGRRLAYGVNAHAAAA